MELTVTVERSSHPEFDLFASMVVNGRQIATRGNASDIAGWIEEVENAAKQYGHTVTVVHNE